MTTVQYHANVCSLFVTCILIIASYLARQLVLPILQHLRDCKILWVSQLTTQYQVRTYAIIPN